MITETIAAPKAQESPTATKGLVLLIDDHKLNRAILRKPLSMEGYSVLEAADGEEGLKLSSERNPDVIILDILMPGIDGFEVCRRLKEDPKTRNIPVLMVTALAERAKLMEGIEAGASDFLSKPVDLREVCLRVRNAANSKQLLEALQKERENSEGLLSSLLPAPIAARMKRGEVPIADTHQETSVLLAELVGFNRLIEVIPPEQVVLLLNEIYSAFDTLTQNHGVRRLKSLGSRYLVVAGIPEEQPDHAAMLAKLAFEMRDFIEQFNHEQLLSIRLKLCISSGPLVAGVIGRMSLAYDVWGSTVKAAWELSSLVTGPELLVTTSTWERLRDDVAFDCERLKVFNSTLYVVHPAKPVKTALEMKGVKEVCPAAL